MSDTEKTIAAVFYRSASGNEPVRDWLIHEIELNDRKRIGTDIMSVEFGWPMGMPTVRPMGDGLHEVRSNLSGSRIARVLFFVHDRQMVLLHAFIKKTAKTPKPDLDLAKSRKKEYLK